jgi:hypothetical protein
MPSAWNTVSNMAVYLASRSPIRNRNRFACSPGSAIRLRARCATQAPFGLVVAPSRCTRGVVVTGVTGTPTTQACRLDRPTPQKLLAALRGQAGAV